VTAAERPEGRPSALLRVEEISAGYAKVPVAKSVSLQVGSGEVALIIGPNGAGKSTLVKAVNGELELLGGSIFFGGRDISQLREDARARLGIGYVPQVNDVFPTLNVQENLEMGGYRLSSSATKARIAELFEQFPQLVPLRRRAAHHLSGGERKLLGVARALVPEPSLLILDEPTANLSPKIADVVLSEVVARLSATGRAVLLIEQRVELALKVSHWVYVLVDGSSKRSGAVEEFREGPITDVFFGGAAIPS
jgi:branched-chain amino acid transport system ATP-binding protein